jgi:hypothetical protein
MVEVPIFKQSAKEGKCLLRVHQLPAASKSDDRLLGEVYRPVGDVFAETCDVAGRSFGELTFASHPGKLR